MVSQADWICWANWVSGADKSRIRAIRCVRQHNDSAVRLSIYVIAKQAVRVSWAAGCYGTFFTLQPLKIACGDHGLLG